MPTDDAAEVNARSSRFLPRWGSAELPRPPQLGWRNWASLIGPGVVMVGANIGGGEWLFGPVVTARYGGVVMWLATLSIGFQIVYNLAVMRYTLYTGEPIFVGFLRTRPGPKFWFIFYLLADSGHIWPYLSSNAAVLLAAAFLGHLPGAEDGSLVRTLSYVIFLVAFIPLIFGGKIYNTVERIMVAKVMLVLGYLTFIDLLMVSKESWYEIFSGFLKFGSLPEGELDWATLAAFAAIAGTGGLANTLFSNYARDKGWGMGAQVGAIPSLVAGKKIALSHIGKVFPIHSENLARWRGWVRLITRDQIAVWGVGSILGMALPSLLSLEFIRGATVEGNAAAAMTARGIASRYGEVFWFLTLLCGFIVFGPGEISRVDGIVRRWTDVVWSGSGRLRGWKGNQVRLVYYIIMVLYCFWGLIALRLTPNPLVLAIVSGALGNIGLGISALHALYISRKLLPHELRPDWQLQLGLVGAFAFFIAISGIAFVQNVTRLLASTPGS